jgi:hypothetical protein
VSIQGPPRLFFEPLKLQSFDFNADTDPHPAFHSNMDPDPASEKNADLDDTGKDRHRHHMGYK